MTARVSDSKVFTRLVGGAFLLLLVVCGGMGLLAYQASSRMLQKSIEEALPTIARGSAGYVRSRLDSHILAVRGVANRHVVKSMDWSLQRPALESETARLGYLAMGIATPDGLVTYQDGSTESLGDLPLLATALGGGTAVSDVEIVQPGGRPVLSIAVPVRGISGEVVAALLTRLDGMILSLMVDEIKYGDRSYSYMIDGKGALIAHGNRGLVLAARNFLQEGKTNPEYSRLSRMMERMAAGETGFGQYWFVGYDRFFGFAPIPGTDWSIAVGAVKDEVFTGIYAMRRNYLALSASFILLGVVIAALFSRTVTDRRRTEEAEREGAIARRERQLLCRETEELRTLLDNIQIQVWYLTDDRTYGTVNKAHAEFCGKTVADMSFKDLGDLFPEDVAEICRFGNQKVFATGRPIHTEEWVPHVSGERRLISIIKSPKLRADGGVEYVVCSAEDITDQRRAEEEKAKLGEQLTHAQKMESVGRLAGGVAHDFNNMLAVIKGNLELAMAELGAESAVYAELDQARLATERSAALTRQLLAFARKQTISPKVLDLNASVEGVLQMLRRLIGEDIELKWQPGENLAPTRVDPSQLEQILANLCVNAADAIDKQGLITISTSQAEIGSVKELPSGFDCAPGEYLKFSVADNGSGMSEEAMAHLFEPFFTTKELGKGTGLGLATVYGIVKQNGGFIDIQSADGRGTTFNIHLPVCRDAEIVGSNSESPPGGDGNDGASILLVEDEPHVLEMTVKILNSLGHKVIAAQSSALALKIAAERRGGIDLLLTDVVMPGMDGCALAEEARKIIPGIKVLFMSGYAAEVISKHGILEDGVNFINKPFTIAEMTARLKMVLGAGNKFSTRSRPLSAAEPPTPPGVVSHRHQGKA